MTTTRRSLLSAAAAAAVVALSATGCNAADEAAPPAMSASAAAEPGSTAEPDASAETGSAAAQEGAAAPAVGQELYAAPESPVLSWVEENASDERAETIRAEIGQQPMAQWFGSWSGPITEATEELTSAAQEEGALPIMVAYNISGRDACGGHSGGGAGSPEAYEAWIRDYARGIGDSPALVILEPDALGDYECMTDAQIEEREGMLRTAIAQFAEEAPNAWVYLDAGNSSWVEADTMAERLEAAGLEDAHGFSLNVSNYLSTESNVAYAEAVNEQLSAEAGFTAPFVIDTSRNGKGEEGVDWCNPAGQQLGETSRWGEDAELLLWIKTPGESDGDCGVGEGSEAGEFLPEVAMGLISGE